MVRPLRLSYSYRNKEETYETRTSSPTRRPQYQAGLRLVEPYIWMAPSIILMCVMIILPIITVFRLSVSEISRAGRVKGFNGA